MGRGLETPAYSCIVGFRRSRLHLKRSTGGHFVSRVGVANLWQKLANLWQNLAILWQTFAIMIRGRLWISHLAFQI